VGTKPKQRSLSQADQRELVRLLGAILDRVYDGTLDAAGGSGAGAGLVRRMEGAKIMLEATLSAVPARKSARRLR
jgi:hypothetical protein